MNYIVPFTLLYVLLFTLQLLGIIFYTDNCTFIIKFGIDFDDLITYIMYGHGVVSILTIPLVVTILEKYYVMWLTVNIIVGMFYFATGITVYLYNDSDTKCKNTGIGLICSGGVQYIACIASLIVEIVKYFKPDEIIEERDSELAGIVRKPHRSFSENSIVRGKDGSLLSISFN
jgi:hypothetical protein